MQKCTNWTYTASDAHSDIQMKPTHHLKAWNTCANTFCGHYEQYLYDKQKIKAFLGIIGVSECTKLTYISSYASQIQQGK